MPNDRDAPAFDLDEHLAVFLEQGRQLMQAFTDMMDDSMQGCTNNDGVTWVSGHTDVAIRPDGDLKLSDARRWLAAFKREK